MANAGAKNTDGKGLDVNKMVSVAAGSAAGFLIVSTQVLPLNIRPAIGAAAGAAIGLPIINGVIGMALAGQTSQQVDFGAEIKKQGPEALLAGGIVLLLGLYTGMDLTKALGYGAAAGALAPYLKTQISSAANSAND